MILNDISHYVYKCLIMYIMLSQVSPGVMIPVPMKLFISALFPV
jgi:hypothetical protein